MQTAPNSHSTAKRTVTASTFKPRVRRLDAGRYLIESASRPGRGHTTTATTCSCIGFSYRKDCKHVALVRALEPSMTAWYDQAAPLADPVTVPMSAGAPSGIKRPVRGRIVSHVVSRALHLDRIDDAERQLASALRALADTDRQADEYVVYLREVDQAERVVAALNYDEMRALA